MLYFVRWINSTKRTAMSKIRADVLLDVSGVRSVYPELSHADLNRLRQVGFWEDAHVLVQSELSSTIFECKEVDNDLATWEVAVTGLLLTSRLGVLSVLGPPWPLSESWFAKLLVKLGFPGPGKPLKKFLDEIQERTPLLREEVAFVLIVTLSEDKRERLPRRVTVEAFKILGR
jgi:hypothetical protein